MSNSQMKPRFSAVLFVAGVPHANGNTYTEEALENLAKQSPFTLSTVRGPDGRLRLVATGPAEDPHG